MKHTSNIILVVILILLLTLVFDYNKNYSNTEVYKQQIKKLQKNIDSVLVLNKQLDQKVNFLHSKVDIIDSSLVGVESNITKIKLNTDEKVSAVNSFTVSELQSFFTARYTKRLDSISESVSSQGGN